MTPAPGEERVQEIERALKSSAHPQGWWYMAAFDLVQRLRAVEAALKDFLDSCAYPEFDDVRLDYISVQIHRDMLAQARAALTR